MFGFAAARCALPAARRAPRTTLPGLTLRLPPNQNNTPQNPTQQNKKAEERQLSREEIAREVRRRKTFAIVAHPDAGKTTLTEKLLLFGGAIHEAGEVKARGQRRAATSDWMELEKSRGISITSTAMTFGFKGLQLNLLDTPGHQDFSEDTYRTLAVADNAVMLVDAAKGIEEQTRKLFAVARMKGLPFFCVVNKMDRPALNGFEIIEQLQKVRCARARKQQVLMRVLTFDACVCVRLRGFTDTGVGGGAGVWGLDQPNTQTHKLNPTTQQLHPTQQQTKQTPTKPKQNRSSASSPTPSPGPSAPATASAASTTAPPGRSSCTRRDSRARRPPRRRTPWTTRSCLDCWKTTCGSSCRRTWSCWR